MILFIDNYDSFTYNLVDYFGQFDKDLRVVRNDKLTLDDVAGIQPDGIVFSPGPGTPNDAGMSCAIIQEYHRTIPILGVCLGHQCIGQVFNGKVIRGKEPVHGKTSDIFHNEEGIFKDIPNPFPATRYHSLILERKSLPSCFEITAQTDDGVIMGIQHKNYSLTSVQFHPESILTEVGLRIIENWIEEIHMKSQSNHLTKIPENNVIGG